MNDPAASFKKLVEVVDTLMAEGGCPWDLVQTRETLKPFLVEEVYETLEALDRGRSAAAVCALPMLPT